MQALSKIMVLVSGLATTGSIWGAVDHDAIIAWSGAIVAASGFVLSAVLAAYHRFRELVREEHAKDLAAGITNAEEKIKAVEAEAEVSKTELVTLKDRFNDQSERLKAVISQRDHYAILNEELISQMMGMKEHIEKMEREKDGHISA